MLQIRLRFVGLNSKTVKEYFQLQFRMVNRTLRDAGILPIFAYPIFLAGFIAVSVYLFGKIEFAEYFYLFIACFFVFKLSEERRNDFLKTCFGDGFRKIRIVENLIISLPFAIFLCFEGFFISAIVLFTLAILLVFAEFRGTLNFTVPTPFYKKPFEFTVGFRKTFYLFLAAYLLTLKAVSVNNFNLGIILLMFGFVIIMNFYAKPENEFYVWSYSLNARQFLFEKLKTALLFSTVLSLPTVLILGISFSQNIHILLLFLAFGYISLMAMIVTKYSAYPQEINLNQGFLLAIGIISPPLLIVMIPYFFMRSTKRLRHLLK